MPWCGVCPSEAHVHCDEITELSVKQLALNYSLGTLVYGHQTWNIFRDSSSGVMLERDVEKLLCHKNIS